MANTCSMRINDWATYGETSFCGLTWSPKAAATANRTIRKHTRTAISSSTCSRLYVMSLLLWRSFYVDCCALVGDLIDLIALLRWGVSCWSTSSQLMSSAPISTLLCSRVDPRLGGVMLPDAKLFVHVYVRLIFVYRCLPSVPFKPQLFSCSRSRSDCHMSSIRDPRRHSIDCLENQQLPVPLIGSTRHDAM